jgi:hypothetical protein
MGEGGLAAAPAGDDDADAELDIGGEPQLQLGGRIAGAIRAPVAAD